jgi:3-oxoacyl-[acyl-carrier protein] reductase
LNFRWVDFLYYYKGEAYRHFEACIMYPDLVGKRVVVTGGAAGIGRATAERFALEGARVSIWDRNEEIGRGTAQAIGADFRAVDVSSTTSVEAAAGSVIALFGGVDILVNNAGILRDGQLLKYKDGALLGAMTDEIFDSVISINLRGVFTCTRALAPAMIASGGGVVLNASSVVALYGNFGQTNYMAAKAGVIGMTRTWARELGRHNIRVNAVAPGLIDTDMTRGMPEKVLAEMKTHTPLRRLGTPDDIANAYAWLASDQAAFVTGAVISVDGGFVPGT